MVLMDVRLKAGVKQHVEAKVAANECLCCNQPAESLGLCSAHYHRFYRKLNRKSEVERETFRAKQIREGRLLKSRQGQRLNLVDEFED